MGGGGFFAGVGLALVVDLDGVCRVELAYLAVFDIDAGNAVACGGHDEGVVEADIGRGRGDGFVPVDVAAAQSEVPFADGCCAVAGLLHEGTEGGGFIARGQDEGCITWQNAGAALAPGILAGEQGIARGGTHGVGAVRIGEEQALIGQLLHMGAGNPAAIGGGVVVAQVIGHEKQDGARRLDDVPCISYAGRDVVEYVAQSTNKPGQKLHRGIKELCNKLHAIVKDSRNKLDAIVYNGFDVWCRGICLPCG